MRATKGHSGTVLLTWFATTCGFDPWFRELPLEVRPAHAISLASRRLPTLTGFAVNLPRGLVNGAKPPNAWNKAIQVTIEPFMLHVRSVRLEVALRDHIKNGLNRRRSEFPHCTRSCSHIKGSFASSTIYDHHRRFSNKAPRTYERPIGWCRDCCTACLEGRRRLLR